MEITTPTGFHGSVDAIAASAAGADVAPPRAAKGGRSGFGGMLSAALEDARETKQVADVAAQQLALGKNTDLHSTMIAMEKADISFQFLMQIRNKIITAYETVMRTQI